MVKVWNSKYDWFIYLRVPYVIKPCGHYLSQYEHGYHGNNIIYETKEISMFPYFKILMK